MSVPALHVLDHHLSNAICDVQFCCDDLIPAFIVRDVFTCSRFFFIKAVNAAGVVVLKSHFSVRFLCLRGLCWLL